MTFHTPPSPFTIRLSISPHRNYPDYDYSCDDNDNRCKIALSRSYPTPWRLWLTERLPANISPFFCFLQSHFVSIFLSLYLVFFFFIIWFFVSLFSVHWFLSPFPAHLLSLFSLFQFSASLSSLLLCSLKPFLVHLTSSTCLQLSFSPHLFSSPSCHSSPLLCHREQD